MRQIMLICVMVSLILIGCGNTDNQENNNVENTAESSVKSTYECDYKSLNFNTSIETTIGDKVVTIEGDILKFIEDPLTMKDSDGNDIAYAGDVYGFISQDDHAIYVNDEFVVNMCGEFDMFGNTYTLKDENENVVGTVTHNHAQTSGAITDTENNIIATFESVWGFNDYTVKIRENDLMSDEAILMIMASFVSDMKADN